MLVQVCMCEWLHLQGLLSEHQTLCQAQCKAASLLDWPRETQLDQRTLVFCFSFPVGDSSRSPGIFHECPLSHTMCQLVSVLFFRWICHLIISETIRRQLNKLLCQFCVMQKSNYQGRKCKILLQSEKILKIKSLKNFEFFKLAKSMWMLRNHFSGTWSLQDSRI